VIYKSNRLFQEDHILSHVVTIKTQVRDAEALRAACRRLNLREPTYQTVRLFSGKATGHTIALPDWLYPVVCCLETGQIEFDNFNGRWGDQKELDRLMQAYAVEKARIEARRAGHDITERQLADGSIRLTVQVVGGAV